MTYKQPKHYWPGRQASKGESVKIYRHRQKEQDGPQLMIVPPNGIKFPSRHTSLGATLSRTQRLAEKTEPAGLWKVEEEDGTLRALVERVETWVQTNVV